MSVYLPEGCLLNTPENLRLTGSSSGLRQAMAQETILEGRAVLCDYEHNLVVDLGWCRGLIPRMEGAQGIPSGSTRDIAIISRVNKPVAFLVRELRELPEGGLLPILSRRLAQERCQREYLSRLVPGDVIPGRVTHLEPFGCFVDIGCGLPSLIPIDQISVSRISHPRDRFRPGGDIRAVVRAVEPGGRVCLSHKELLGTWEENAARFHPGETVAGIVRSVEEYGIFVELAPNLAGLAEPCPGVVPGQQASVYIKSILPGKMKVKLIIVDAFDAPWSPAPPEYFFQGSHMERWRYSAPQAKKVIETVFEDVGLQAEARQTTA